MAGGCILLPEDVGAQIMGVLNAAPENFLDELAALRSRLHTLGATADDVAHAERSIRVFRWLDRRVDLDDVLGLGAQSRLMLGAMEASGWRRVADYARSRLRMFGRGGRARTGAISAVKGILAEELFYSSRAFAGVMQRARARASLLGFDAADVRFVRGTRGVTMSERSGRWVNHGELTDGIIYVTRRRQLNEAERAERLAERGRQYDWAAGRRGVETDVEEEIHLLALIESKSPSNVDQIAAGHGGNWLGQMDNDLERFAELPALVGGRWYSPSQLTVSRYRTEWVAVMPRYMEIAEHRLQRLGLAGAHGRNYRPFNLDIEDHVLNAVAEALLRAL